MNWLAGGPEGRRRRDLILIGLIVLAGVCYLPGLVTLLFASSNQVIVLTPTPTATPTATPPGETPSPSHTLPPTPTQFNTPTFTPTPTASTTPTPAPTLTPTPP